MARDPVLKEIEKRAFKSFFEDGLWDIYLGLILGVMALSRVLDSLDVSEGAHIALLVGVYAAVIGIFVVGKKWITTPRLGTFKPGVERKKRISKVRLGLSLSVLLGLFFFAMGTLVVRGDLTLSGDAPWGSVVGAVWAVQSVLLFSFGAYYLDFPRLYVYAWLFAIPLPVMSVAKDFFGADVDPLLAFGPSVLIMVAVGAYRFVRFLRDYPLPAAGAARGTHA